jgi:hypothetical protein
VPDDLSGFAEEVREAIFRKNGTPHVALNLNGVRVVREFQSFILEPDDCDINFRRRWWCSLFGHTDPQPHHVAWAAKCYCGALAVYVVDTPPAGYFLHVGRCGRCNSPHMPRAIIVR